MGWSKERRELLGKIIRKFEELNELWEEYEKLKLKKQKRR